MESGGDQIAPRRFEYKTRDSYKFWTIELHRTEHIVRFGPIGSRGQLRSMLFDSCEEARAQYDRRVTAKLSNGYHEVKKSLREEKSAAQWKQEWLPHLPFMKLISKDVFDIDNYMVYADWLIDQQDPLGEFMHIQIALADPKLELYRRPELEREAGLIQSNHCRHWFRELAPFCFSLANNRRAVAGYKFHLGLLSELEIDILTFGLADGLRQSPYCQLLTRLSINEIADGISNTDSDSENGDENENGDEHGDEHGDTSNSDATALSNLIGAPLFNLRQLSVGRPPAPFDRPNAVHLAEVIASAPQLQAVNICAVNFDLATIVNHQVPNVTSWHQHYVNDFELSVLLQSPLVRQLKIFGLPDNRLTDEGGRLLASCKEFHSLSSLFLSTDGLSSDVRHEIYASGLPVILDSI
ncbi:MAG: hypothetical protein ACI9G1_005407 [Pirellulaceae bacterium]|jgi:uncharacterized protein (TIGR02996 family)